MDRIGYVQELLQAPRTGNADAFRYALVGCLSASEACDAVDRTFTQRYSDRRLIQNKVIRDASADLTDSHRQLVKELISVLPDLEYRQQQAASTFLRQLTEAQPALYRDEVLRLLLASHLAPIRRQALSSLRRKPDAELMQYLPQIWEEWHDLEAIELLVQHAPPEWLATQFDAVLEHVGDGRLLSRLAIRVPQFLEKLFPVDPVAYLYAASKLGRQVADERLRSIFDERWFAEDQGLVIWCIGQMQRWDLLVELREANPPPGRVPPGLEGVVILDS